MRVKEALGSPIANTLTNAVRSILTRPVHETLERFNLKYYQLIYESASRRIERRSSPFFVLSSNVHF